MYTWEVHGYRPDFVNGYIYMAEYRGRSLFKAILAMWKCRQENVQCIKLEWRPK